MIMELPLNQNLKRMSKMKNIHKIILTILVLGVLIGCPRAYIIDGVGHKTGVKNKTPFNNQIDNWHYRRKLEKLIRATRRKYGDPPYSARSELKILMDISFWVQMNTVYTPEGQFASTQPGKMVYMPDVWVASLQKVLDEVRGGYFRDDCDGYAMLGYYIAQEFGIRRLRLAILYQKIGKAWYENGHMVLLYKGGDKSILVPSTGELGKWKLTLPQAFRAGWWVAESFNDSRHWTHNRPRLKNIT